jgi:opacity protein-like surface antigen
MKKTLFFIVIAVICYNVNAQDNASNGSEGVSFGVKAGADFGSMRIEVGNVSVSESDTGFYAGLFAEIGISDIFAFQPEVLYISIEDFDQIHIPLMAKFGVSDEFYLLVGPSLGILLSPEEGLKSFNYGVEGGVVYDITEELFIEARYNIGLANLIEDAPSGYSLKISQFFVGLGYRF